MVGEPPDPATGDETLTIIQGQTDQVWLRRSGGGDVVLHNVPFVNLLMRCKKIKPRADITDVQAAKGGTLDLRKIHPTTKMGLQVLLCTDQFAVG